eukprot:TRINITY_DN909_c0_g1_i3.p1 TRINITY_DN909_c0_g1~~TRINITY_DN909_c0_g1_i3.p1  ORF type:complete len:337 (-),score=75.00 TRINITY_DN909_c0_g1_i3:236-1144(-)
MASLRIATLLCLISCAFVVAEKPEELCEDAPVAHNSVSQSLLQTATEKVQKKVVDNAVKVATAEQAPAKGIQWRAAAAEFVAMTLFVIIGCGSAMSIAKEPGSAWVLQVSLTFGLAITSLAYAVGHYSGAQINCAVTFGLVLVGNLSIMQGLVNFAAQMLGAVVGACFLLGTHVPEEDKTGGLGCNGVGPGSTQITALVGEIMMTFLLMFVVLETAVSPATLANREMAPLAIGIAVFLAHSVLIPIDGCSINPTRSFGPAVVANFLRKPAVKDPWTDMWVFWVGPLVGAAAAVGVFKALAAM